MARPRPKTSKTLHDILRHDGTNAGWYSEQAIQARERSLVQGYARELRMGSAKYWAAAQGPDSPQALAKRGTSPQIRG